MSDTTAGREEFIAWFVANYPGPNTIISKPDWHAPKIFRAATHRLERENAELRAVLDASQALANYYQKSVDVGPNKHPTREGRLWSGLRDALARAAMKATP